jgi:anti-anti-sigma factor
MIYSSWMAARAEGMCVFLTGEVDLSVSDHLYEVLGDALRQSIGPIEVNLRGLRLLDCSGIAALLRARDDARQHGRVLFVSEPRGIVRRVLDLTGVLTVLTAVPLGSSPPCGTDRRRLEAT